MRMGWMLVLVACFTVVNARRPHRVPQHGADKTNLVQSTNAFAMEMYTKLAKVPGNVFFSPFSIFSALSMTSLGAKGNTLNEMLKTLKIENYEKDIVHSWYKSFSQRLFNEKSQQDYTLSHANRLFGEKSDTILDKFLQDTSEYYGAQLESLDFKKKFEESRRHINDWVSSETNNKIKDILAPGVIDNQTKLVLVNAIYFKGDWLSKFLTHNTMKKDYYVTNTEIIRVTMMGQILNVRYGFSEALQSQVLELPYKGDSISMVVLLPNLKHTTLAELEHSLTPSALSSLRLKKSKVELSLPKFKIESSFNLNEQLKQMGMADLFRKRRADLSGMNGKKDLYVSAVVHKSFVVVNEGGTEAAAATAGVMEPTGAARPEIIPEFRADHPFLFYIRDTKTNSILFFGRFIKP